MTTTTATTASPIKLRDGSWGAKIRSADVEVGDVVTIQTKAGKTWQATVTQVVWTGSDWTGSDAAIVRTESHDRPAAGSRSHYGRGRQCITGGNCSSFGSGRSCGGYDCDGYEY